MANEFIARNGVIALANSTISGSLVVTNNVTGSIFTGSFIGPLTGTASYSTLALTASYFSGSISNAVTATSASYAATASYALNAGASTGGGTVGGQALLTQSIAATTWSFNHNLGTTYPVVTVYDSASNAVIQPLNIVPSGSNDMKIYFSTARAGYATAVAGGGYFVTNNGTTRQLVQSTPATTWSFAHNIGDQYPAFEIYDSNNNVIIPAAIVATDAYTAQIQFAYSASGRATATLGGGIGVGTVITVSTASSTWALQHNLNTSYPIVTIWESGSNQIIQPDTVTSVDANNITVGFTTPVRGWANVSRAGSVISGSTDWNLLINKPNVGVVYSQSTPSATWSIPHNLGTQFPLVTVYDSSNTVVIPQSIVGVDTNNITITFPSAQTGTVNLSKAGNYISGSILWSNITNGPFSTTGSVTAMSGSLIITGSLTVSGSGTFNNIGPANFTGSTYISSSNNTQLLVGTNILFISASGNVGIGTTGPRIALEVIGTDATSSTTSTPNGAIMVSNPTVSNSQVMTMGVVNGVSNHSWIQSRNSTTANFYSLALNPNGGNVSIGTGSSSFPAGAGLYINNATRSNLTLTDGTNVYNVFQDTTSAYHDLRTTGDIVWRTTSGNTERMRIASGGDVKIDSSVNWSYSNLRALQVRGSNLYNYPGYSGWASNIYYNGGWKYYESYGGGYAEFDSSGGFSIYTTPSGTGGNAATTTQRFGINQTGQVLITDKVIISGQPSFAAYKSTNEEPTSDTILSYDTTIINRGNNYNTSNSRFTAPVAGVYAFGVKVWFKINLTGTIWVYLRINGAVYTEQRMSISSAAADFNTFFPKWIVNLSAGDYVEVSGYGNNSNFHSSNTARYSQFYGHLLH